MKISFSVNGERADLDVEPRRTLADALREDCGLTGTHLGCEHGVCGACTILVDGEPVRACLMFAVQADGASVSTVEGLQGTDGELHPVQEAFVACHGLQCGFCTPGMLMSACHLLDTRPDADRETIRAEMSGNICRCTGYQGIVAAVERARADMRDPAGPGEGPVHPWEVTFSEE
ncbi:MULTISPECIES: (2Fe-2S)-binding protein [Pseudonocardia]|uniref:6-hydroxypseudooxynicotine dehydrogenase complex subunit beta n=2 Tax=Pseudonocardia TaxID=1847 RepID=A0A1Y2MSL0_PSEAH|nr:MULTISPECIES: (2Fe-2S)-binding protein [Pseudonocardia]OSY38204.1 6-hydroxypseudooxynicotine dehydrogenase complex subunit beta [Pseudonocardia autotrophica]TDN71071.1 carbon-monoxide dehydrogenase small subunit [Pseudonocardia autotrophica]BBG01740.1 (2Fe-2S)-binding protein [Pseudonocardia autotrophica]GEC27385.1 (2Fe-2S)-binding protein [Pseudonocardia saturnea]